MTAFGTYPDRQPVLAASLSRGPLGVFFWQPADPFAPKLWAPPPALLPRCSSGQYYKMLNSRIPLIVNVFSKPAHTTINSVQLQLHALGSKGCHAVKKDH